MQLENRRIFTIGHSNQTMEEFLELLAGQGIQVVVDVRSSPYSKYAGQFNREPLKSALKKAGFFYLFLGDALGGMPQDRRFYDQEGYVVYKRIAESPDGCHRHLMISRVLRDRRGYGQGFPGLCQA